MLCHLKCALVTFVLLLLQCVRDKNELCGKAYQAAFKYCSVGPDLTLIVELLTLNCFVSNVEALGVSFTRIPELVVTCSVSPADKNLTIDRCSLSFGFLSIHAFPQYSFSFEHGSRTRKLYV